MPFSLLKRKAFPFWIVNRRRCFHLIVSPPMITEGSEGLLAGKPGPGENTVDQPSDLNTSAQRERILRSMFVYWSVWGLLMGFVGKALPPGEILSGLIAGGAALLLMEWVHRDRRIVGYDLGFALDLTILFLLPLGLFIYFVRSRGWLRGLGLFGLAAIVFLGLVTSYAIAATIGHGISLLLLHQTQ